MDLTKQTTELESIEDLEQTKPQTLGDVRNWLKRVGKDKEIVISPLIQSTNDFSEDGVYVCNKADSAEMEFIAVKDGDVNNLVEQLYIFYDVYKDWKEYYTKPQSLGDIRGWIIRSEAGWVFEMSDEKVHGLSVGVEIKIPFNSIESAKEYGINLSGTKFIPYGTEEGKELDGIIEFFIFYGVQPDWETDEENSTDIFNFIISKPTSLYDVEDWIRRVGDQKYSIIKMVDLPKGPMVSTHFFVFNTMSVSFELVNYIDHAEADYDEVIAYIEEKLEIKKDWE